jgi:hypothetical protein
VILWEGVGWGRLRMDWMGIEGWEKEVGDVEFGDVGNY